MYNITNHLQEKSDLREFCREVFLQLTRQQDGRHSNLQFMRQQIMPSKYI
jgi:hypothetical protein